MPEPAKRADDRVVSSPSREHLLALQLRAVSVAESVAQIDLRAYETSAASSLEALCARARELVQAALSLLDETLIVVGEDSELTTASAEDAAFAEVGAELTRATPRRGFSVALERTLQRKAELGAVSEVAFVSRLALSSLRDLEARAFGDPLETLSRCGAALGHTRKALTALDEAIARAESVPRRTNVKAELRSALAIRRGYSILRRRIHGGGEPEPDTLVARFRSAGTWIAMLIGWDIYPDMRQSDRLLFRRFQARILSWLANEPRDVRAGLSLWSDLSCFLQMLTSINRRQEILDHDRNVVLGLCRHGLREDDVELLRRELEEISGLDDELDDLLESELPPDRRRLSIVLEGLCRRFSARFVAL